MKGDNGIIYTLGKRTGTRLFFVNARDGQHLRGTRLLILVCDNFRFRDHVPVCLRRTLHEERLDQSINLLNNSDASATASLRVLPLTVQPWLISAGCYPIRAGTNLHQRRHSIHCLFHPPIMQTSILSSHAAHTTHKPHTQDPSSIPQPFP